MRVTRQIIVLITAPKGFRRELKSFNNPLKAVINLIYPQVFISQSV